MNEHEKIHLLAQIRSLSQAHLNEIFRLEAVVKRLDLLAMQVARGSIDLRLLEDKKILAVTAPENASGLRFWVPPQDANGDTTVTDAIRLTLDSMPPTFKLSDIKDAVVARYPHVPMTRSFTAIWQYVRARDPRIVETRPRCYEYKK